MSGASSALLTSTLSQSLEASTNPTPEQPGSSCRAWASCTPVMSGKCIELKTTLVPSRFASSSASRPERVETTFSIRNSRRYLCTILAWKREGSTKTTVRSDTRRTSEDFGASLPAERVTFRPEVTGVHRHDRVGCHVTSVADAPAGAGPPPSGPRVGEGDGRFHSVQSADHLGHVREAILGPLGHHPPIEFVQFGGYIGPGSFE